MTLPTVYDPHRVNLYTLIDTLARRSDESFGSWSARTHIKNGSPTEPTVDYLMFALELPAEQRNRIRHLVSNLVRKYHTQ